MKAILTTNVRGKEQIKIQLWKGPKGVIRAKISDFIVSSHKGSRKYVIPEPSHWKGFKIGQEYYLFVMELDTATRLCVSSNIRNAMFYDAVMFGRFKVMK